LESRQSNVTDLANAVVALPLRTLLHSTSHEEIIEEIKALISVYPEFEVNTAGQKFELGHHIASSLINCPPDWRNPDFFSPEELRYIPWHETDSHIPIDSISVLVAAWMYPDCVQFDVTGGKRDLGETSLECAIRETFEETGIDLNNPNIRGADDFIFDLSTKNDNASPWYLTHRLKGREMTTCLYLFLHESILQTHD
jgi:hypothetical protein